MAPEVSGRSAPGTEWIEQILAGMPAFSSLGREEIREIVETSKRLSFKPTEMVVREGELASGFFLILEGQVEVRKRSVSLRRMGPGQFFGETSLVEGEPRTADVVATQQTICLKIEGPRFRDLVQDNPRVMAKLLEEIIRRNRTSAQVPAEKVSDRTPAVKFEFESELARTVFESLAGSFIHDYMMRRIVEEKCGWRTITEIAQDTGASARIFYGKRGGIGPALAEPISRGLVETRYFPGERGRGGEIMRFRIDYDREPVKAYVNQKIRAGKES